MGRKGSNQTNKYTDLDLYQQCYVLQKTEDFKDIQGLWGIFQYFQGDLILMDFSRKPSKSKYFSSLC